MTGPTRGVTPSQLRYLAAIADLAAEGPPPTIREVAERCGVYLAAVHQQLVRLRRHGLVDWRPGQCRTLEVTEAGVAALQNWSGVVSAEA